MVPDERTTLTYRKLDMETESSFTTFSALYYRKTP